MAASVKIHQAEHICGKVSLRPFAASRKPVDQQCYFFLSHSVIVSYCVSLFNFMVILTTSSGDRVENSDFTRRPSHLKFATTGGDQENIFASRYFLDASVVCEFGSARSGATTWAKLPSFTRE